MKNFIYILFILCSLRGYSLDQPFNEIICTKMYENFEVDIGLEIVIQSKMTSSKKRIVVIQNGYSGPIEVDDFFVNTDQPLIGKTADENSQYQSTYRADGLELKILSADEKAKHLLGPATAKLNTKIFGAIELKLNCLRIH